MTTLLPKSRRKKLPKRKRKKLSKKCQMTTKMITVKVKRTRLTKRPKNSL